ncbi:MAG: UDP-N-acetylmuramate--alanine ligase [Oceanicoccus sp.]|jgi:UDP-N-acetylmuramate--alanine ligase
MTLLKEVNQIHCIGIGGIGLSAIARFFLAKGKVVTGSDMKDSELIQDLIKEGAQITLSHGGLPEGTEAVIYSEAIPKSNPERLAAKDMPILNYFEALGEVSKDYKLIAIAGTHGKTTTTAMLGYLLQETGFDPTVLVGSKVPQFGGKNFRMGQSEWMVVEACEYRRNFLPLRPHLLGVTNMELDHLDYFKDEADYKAAFEKLKSQSDKLVEAISFTGPLGVPGEHNRWNAGLAAALAKELGLEDYSSLEHFKGTWRRFERRGEWNGAPVIDDYAHHPTELTVTINTARQEFPKKRLVAVFQPHQHTRAAAFMEGFAQALKLADLVIIPNIYATRDTVEDKESMSVERFVGELEAAGVNVLHTGDLAITRNWLDSDLNEEDVLLVMGAGNVTSLIES